jgi:hypothetical protein
MQITINPQVTDFDETVSVTPHDLLAVFKNSPTSWTLSFSHAVASPAGSSVSGGIKIEQPKRR